MHSLLYVDDEPDLLHLGKLFLERSGEFSVTTFTSPLEALENLATTTYDAIISDYQMPEMDGLELLKIVRSRYGNLPFILFTGRGREEVVIEAINNGVDFYLQKGGPPKAQFAELRHKLHTAIDRRRAIDALKSENEKNKSLMDNASDAIFISDVSTGLFIDANRKAQEITGRTSDEIRGSSHLAIHPAEYHEQYRELLTDIARAGCGSVTLVLIGNGGRRIPVIASFSAIELDGRSCLMGIFHDISEIQMTQEALQLANKKLTLLAEITRHDIRNKLTVIGGYLDMMRTRPAEPDYSMYLRKIKTTVKVIGDNIEFTKLYQDLGASAPAWQNVHDTFFRACSRIDIKNISVQSDTQGIEVFSDPLFERAFYNFIENSLQHGGNVSVIRISAKDPGDGSATICIEDNGNGIPPFDKENIFSKGYGRNTGLGLFLVQEILSTTGITVRETGEYHKGARFELTVPEGAFRYPRDAQGARCHILTPATDNP
jgi:PAS domain S-box-containing protein